MIKKSVVATLFFALLIALPIVLAEAEFNVIVSPEMLSIKDNETAVYDLVIQHDSASSEFFQVFSPDVSWNIWTKDALLVKPYDTFSTKLYIQPIRVGLGTHSLTLDTKMTGSTSFVEKNILVDVQSSLPPLMKYLPALSGRVMMPEQIDPREPSTITIYLENRNRINLSSIVLKTRSSTINNDYTISLDGFEKKNFTFDVQLDAKTAPAKDTLKAFAIVELADKTVYQFDLLPAKYEVVSYDALGTDEQIEKSFLKTKRTITLTNNGNHELQTAYKYPMGFFKRVFTVTDPDATIKEGSFVWQVNLVVGGSTAVIITTNYIALPIILLVILLVILLYYLFRSPIVLAKKVVIIGTREGGISELKVFLGITNRSKNKIKNLEAIDVIPRLAELIKEEEIGSLKPVKVVKHETKGTILKWYVGDLNAGDQRVITYKMKSGLSILGGVSLPVAIGRFETSPGSRRTTTSNVASIDIY